jgi:putative endonuclease
LACEIKAMHYVYVLHSTLDDGLYIGCTKDLKKRVKQHQSGSVMSTKNRRPLELAYYEACLDQKDAYKRERYLKTTYGRRYLKNRLKGYFTG